MTVVFCHNLIENTNVQMDWISVPLELFAIIVVDLDLASIVRLEQACKSFQDNLKNKNLWKEIAHRHFPSYSSTNDTENWRDVALTRYRVRKNMREKKCLSRAIQTKESLTLYNIMTHICSVAGNEALITLINEAQDYSYSTTTFLAHELVNLITGERQRIQFDQPNVLLTKNYIVTSDGYVTHTATYGTSPLKVVDRKTGETFDIAIDKIGNNTGVMQNDEVENYDTICLNVNTDFYVVDLKERTVHHFQAMNETGSGINLPFQFYGKYIAYARTVRFRGNNTLRLTVIDTETGNQVFFEQNSKLLDWAIADNKVFLGSHTENGIQWVLKNFKGEILLQYNLDATASHLYHQSSVRIFEHVIAYFKRTHLYFFDSNNGQLLCCLEIIGTTEYGSAPNLRALSPGKFIYSQRHSTRLIDFESQYITKPIKVSIVSPDGFSNTLPKELPERVPFNALFDFTRTIAEVEPAVDLSFYSSICVNQTKDKRTSMIYCNDVVTAQKAGHLQHDNNTATKLFAKENNLRIYSHINMNATSFSDSHCQTMLQNLSACARKPGAVINDRVVLYNEAFVNGEWVPVDFEEDKTTK